MEGKRIFAHNPERNYINPHFETKAQAKAQAGKYFVSKRGTKLVVIIGRCDNISKYIIYRSTTVKMLFFISDIYKKVMANQHGHELNYTVYEIVANGQVRQFETAYCLVQIRSFESEEEAVSWITDEKGQDTQIILVYQSIGIDKVKLNLPVGPYFSRYWPTDRHAKHRIVLQNNLTHILKQKKQTLYCIEFASL